MNLDAVITQYKEALIKKARKKGIWEYFGQKEVRELNDKYPDEWFKPDSPIKEFENWVQNFDLRLLKSATEDMAKRPKKVITPLKNAVNTDLNFTKQRFYKFYKKNRLKLRYDKDYAVYYKYAKLIAKLLTDDESVLSGVEELPKHNLHNYLLNISNNIFTITGIKPAPVRANFISIYQKRLNKDSKKMFKSSNDVRIFTEYVLNSPDDWVVDNKTGNYLFMRENGVKKLVVVRLELRNNEYHVRSAYYTNEKQWNTKIEKNQRLGRYPHLVGGKHNATTDTTNDFVGFIKNDDTNKNMLQDKKNGNDGTWDIDDDSILSGDIEALWHELTATNVNKVKFAFKEFVDYSLKQKNIKRNFFIKKTEDNTKYLFTADSIRHIKNHHGSKSELKRGQIPVTPELYLLLIDLINKPDKTTISYEYKNYRYSKFIKLEKVFENIGINISINGVSSKGRVELITGYIKKNAELTDDYAPILTSKNAALLNNHNETDENLLHDDLENNKFITLEMYEDREKLNSFIHQNIIPKLFAHTANYFKDYKVFFDDRADSYFYLSDEDSQWGYQLILTRQFGMPYRHREIFWWSQIEAIITDLYRTYLNQLVKSKKRTTWDIEKYKEYFLYKFYGYSHIKFYNLYSKYVHNANDRKLIRYFKLIYSLIPNESVIK